MTEFDWNHTATNLLGDKRDTMTCNMLHLRPALGRSNTYCHKIKPCDFTYGMKTEKIDGVSDVMIWPKAAFKAKLHNEKKQIENDRIILNKEAIKSGACTEKEAKVFRATHEQKKQPKPRSRTTSKSTIPSHKVINTLTHGIASRPSTPIFELISNRYQNEWVANQKKLRAQRLALEKKKKKPHNATCFNTRTTLLREQRITVDEPELWNMSMFKTGVVNGISSFRDEKSRELAYKAHKNESVGRHGGNGQGIVRLGEVRAC
ncbi:hypothetical protein Ciccas_008979 [Cichlidogyrus casuarinus]|uniref:Uncharacterized protein n=1 Tax=Cichlidogyrus casuarinus TaxID=1844966 RepID=A0ABD2PZ11_9PLAT